MEIALYRPEIPPNTGNIARLSVCIRARLSIIGKPSFSMAAADVKRAGLDYWDRVDLHQHESWEAFLEQANSGGAAPTILLFSKYGKRPYSDHAFTADDILVFGRESSGLPDFVVESVSREHPERVLRIPVAEDCRSLNLGNAVAVVCYEALRQQGFPGLSGEYNG